MLAGIKKTNGGGTPLMFPVLKQRCRTGKSNWPNSLGCFYRLESPVDTLRADGGQPSDETEREFEYEPVVCEDCREYVVVTRNPDADYADDDPRFECGCKVGAIGAVKPDTWTGGSFL